MCGNVPNQIYGDDGWWDDNGGNTISEFCTIIDVPGDYESIQEAINASSHVINIAAGTYNEYNLNPGGKAITSRGPSMKKMKRWRPPSMPSKVAVCSCSFPGKLENRDP